MYRRQRQMCIRDRYEGNGRQMLVEQDNMELVRSCTSKEMACTTILNLLFKSKIECLYFRSFFPLIKSMKLWDIDKKNELREYIENNNVYNICKRGNLEIIVTRDDSRLICYKYNVEDIVSLIKCLLRESSSDIPLNNLYELFKDMNVFKEEKCEFKQLLRNEKFRFQTISRTEYVRI